MNDRNRITAKADSTWTAGDHLRWELKWSIVEWTGILTGLSLLFVADPVGIGWGIITLWMVLVMSLVVRFRHYWRCGSR